jgi:uncharacterized protein YjbI with pentapeptide repeats
VPIRELAGGRSIHLPAVDPDDLAAARLDAELDLRAAMVEGGSYEGLVAEGTIDGSLLSGVDLSGAKLGPLTLSDVVLRQVDLSNASLQQVVARRVEWQTCRAIGVRLSVDYATDLSIVDSRIDYAVIHLEKVKGVAVFSGCSFREATISGDLSNTVFVDCDFVGTEFRARTASKCDLRASRLNEARGLLTLKGATISLDQAVAISAMIATEAGLIVAD